MMRPQSSGTILYVTGSKSHHVISWDPLAFSFLFGVAGGSAGQAAGGLRGPQARGLRGRVP
jgi:hypothetical protein